MVMGFDIRRNLFSPDGDVEDRAARKYIDTLLQHFLDSPEAEALPDAKVDLGWALNQMRLGIDYLGVTPPQTSPADLNEIVFELFPRKVAVRASEAPAIVRELVAFWHFLGREFGLDNAAACVELLEADGAARLKSELSNPSNFGPGKRFATFGQEAGFDLSTEAGTAQAMLAYNSAISGSRSFSNAPLDSGIGQQRRPPPQNLSRAQMQRKKRRRAAKASRKKNRKRK